MENRSYYGKYITPWNERLKRERLDRKKRAERARAVALKCAEVLAERYGVDKVYLIGSAVGGERFHDRSDIDLVVEGLPPKKHIAALNDIWDIVSEGDFEVDLIPFEDASVRMKNRVISDGEVLYDSTKIRADKG